MVAEDANSTIVPGPSTIILRDELSFSMVGNDTLTLLFDGNAWREASRTT